MAAIWLVTFPRATVVSGTEKVKVFHRFASEGVYVTEMLPALNRCAVIVTPKQPFLDWLWAVDWSNLRLTMADIVEPTIHLLPACEDDETMARWIRKYAPAMFEDQLQGWWTEAAAWPTDRSYKRFKLWFAFEANTMLLDLCDRPWPTGFREPGGYFLFLKNSSGVMYRPMGLVRTAATGLPAGTASRTSRRSCTVGAWRARPSATYLLSMRSR